MSCHGSTYFLDSRLLEPCSIYASEMHGFHSTPQLPWVLLFLVWASITVLIRAPSAAFDHILGLTICVALFLLIAHGVQSFQALHVVAGTVLAMVLFVCGVGVHQGFAPTGCVTVDQSNPGDTATGKPDGRPCENPRSCYGGDAEPGADYLCEHIGLFGTTSVGARSCALSRCAARSQ